MNHLIYYHYYQVQDNLNDILYSFVLMMVQDKQILCYLRSVYIQETVHLYNINFHYLVLLLQKQNLFVCKYDIF
ncbi:MAG: hypothetical protein CMO04_20640 [Thalassospira sp.]|nr:hypothetical protein [Thalassospira sp.]